MDFKKWQNTCIKCGKPGVRMLAPYIGPVHLKCLSAQERVEQLQNLNASREEFGAPPVYELKLKHLATITTTATMETA